MSVCGSKIAIAFEHRAEIDCYLVVLESIGKMQYSFVTNVIAAKVQRVERLQ